MPEDRTATRSVSVGSCRPSAFIRSSLHALFRRDTIWINRSITVRLHAIDYRAENPCADGCQALVRGVNALHATNVAQYREKHSVCASPKEQRIGYRQY